MTPDGQRVRQVAPDGTTTIYIGQWYEESWGAERGGGGGTDSLSTSQPSYAPGEAVQFTLSGCHRYAHTQPFQVYLITDQKEELIYAPPSQPISPTVTTCFATWRWEQRIASDQAAALGVYRVRVATADGEPGASSYAADFVLEDPNAGQPIVSCPLGCGGLQARPNASGGLEVRYTNLTGHILYTAALSYTVEREVKGQWGLVYGPAPVPTATLRLYPGQTLLWTWAANDNQGEAAPAGEYRVVLLGTGEAVASAGESGGAGAEAQTRTRTNYYYLGSLSEVTTGTAGLYARQRYHPYGQVRYSEGTPPTTYNFTGQRLDGTGLLYYGARYYDPMLLRFV